MGGGGHCALSKSRCLQAEGQIGLELAGPDSAVGHCFGMISRTFPPIALIGLSMLAGCGDGDRSAGEERVVEERTVVAAPVPPDSPGSVPMRASDAWDLVSRGEGVALVFPASGVTSTRLFCPAGQDRILINVPSFRPIATEERMTFGSGSAAEALVADTRGDQQRGGVSATGPVPRDLAALIGGPVSASYGAQRIGPHPAPLKALARDFIAACGETKASPTSSASASGISACLIQDGERLSVALLRGVAVYGGSRNNRSPSPAWSTHCSKSPDLISAEASKLAISKRYSQVERFAHVARTERALTSAGGEVAPRG